MSDDASRQLLGPSSASFVVRIIRNETGRLSGVVVRVRTGRKARFDDAGTIGALIVAMLDDLVETEEPR